MDWYEEPINPECAPKQPETFRERYAREMAARIMANARAETELALGATLPTDFYTQRFMRKD